MTMTKRDERVDADVGALEECITHAEHASYELAFFDHQPEARELALDIHRATQALRLALVADAEPAILTRIQLRLETLTRQSAAVIARCESLPASQRPTAPPPFGMDPVALLSADEPTPSDRPTIRPDAPANPLRPPPTNAKSSGVVSKVESSGLFRRKSKNG